jgi:hypothetical protein
MKTYKNEEQALLSTGFELEVSNRFISRFKSNNQYAFIIYLGLGNGFRTDYYPIEAGA